MTKKEKQNTIQQHEYPVSKKELRQNNPEMHTIAVL